MSSVLDRNLFFVREHTGVFKAANNYDILDPETGEEIIHCREPVLGRLTRVLRFTDFKQNTPFALELTTAAGVPLLRVKRGWSFLRSRVKVYDSQGYVGSFHQRLMTIGGAFRVLDADGRDVCSLQGSWTGWNFKFMFGDRELAVVSKKWSGLGKELFTSADNYMLSIDSTVPAGSNGRKLILAAVMCIDMVLKE